MKATPEEYDFHCRILARNDPIAFSMLADYTYGSLVQRVQRRAGKDADPVLVEEAVGMALLDYRDAPEHYDPKRMDLQSYLAMMAYHDFQKAPRERAISIFGSTILPILDGERSPTDVERIHAVLSTVHLGSMSHVMERPDDGLPSNIVLDIEDRADRLAFELLAPASLLQEHMQQSTVRGFKARLIYLTQHLFTVHGLPECIASSYARYILHQIGEPTFRDMLFHLTE